MHALNCNHIPYALHDDDDEIDDNDSDDVFYDDDDGNDDDHHIRRHLCHCHHDYHNSHLHRHNHQSCHHHHHCHWHHHHCDYWHYHQLFIITIGIRNNIYLKYVISGKGSWRTHTLYACQITTYFLRWSTSSFSLYSSSLSLSSSPSSSFISLPS